MKALIFVAVALVSSSVAYAQGSTGKGGGSLTPATEEDVRSTVIGLLGNEKQGSIVHDLSWIHSALVTIDGADVKEIFAKIIDLIEPKGQDKYWPINIWKNAYRFETNGPCVGQDGPQQASTEYGKPGATICYSIPLLTKLPKARLRDNLATLTAHEIAHQFGAQEAVAKRVENFFSDWIWQLDEVGLIDDELHQIYSFSQLTPMGYAGEYPSRSGACVNLALIVGRAAETERHYSQLVSVAGIHRTDEVTDAFFKALWLDSADTRGMCFNGGRMTEAALSDQEKQAFTQFYDGMRAAAKLVEATLPIRTILGP